MSFIYIQTLYKQVSKHLLRLACASSLKTQISISCLYEVDINILT